MSYPKQKEQKVYEPSTLIIALAIHAVHPRMMRTLN